MSGPTTFSYAQAAKGQKTAPANAQPTTAQPDSHVKDDASSVTTGPDAAANTFSTTSEISESAKSSQIDIEVAGAKKTQDTLVIYDAPTALSKDDTSSTARDETPKTNAQSTTDKATRQSNRSGETTDSKKSRKGRKGKSSEKEAENEQAPVEPEKEVVPVKLTEAPQPAVNIWVQRAAAAKARQPSIVASPLASADVPTKAGLVEAPKTVNSTETQTPDTTRGPTKFADTRQSIDQSARKNPRGNRTSDKSEQSSKAPSAVEDATMWPTPETAAAEDSKRKTSETDQLSKEKVDDGFKSMRQKRDWKKVEITPTVVFNTPLPQQRTMNKVRGGGQAGRSSASRGHASSISSEKGQVVAASDATATKEGADSQGRSREDAPSRTNSVPVEKIKKIAVEQQNQRKQSVPSVNRGVGPADYTSRNETSKGSKTESIQFTRGEGPEGSRKEGGFPGHKDSKPRRGAHGNSRGGHNGQQAFLSNGHGGTRSNTYSPPNFTTGFPPNQFGGSSRGGRGRPVSLSNGFKGPSNGAPKMHQNTQSASSEYGQYPPAFGHAPYPSHSDYNSVNYPQLVHDALKKQIEYYFSESNLVKDMFLRAHMDAQGFVPLDIIAEFRRITTIVGNLPRDFLRNACADSKEIDFVLGDGHRELVRARENWQRWVLEGDAKESGRNPGPTSFEHRSWHNTHLNSNYYVHQPHSLPYTPYNPMSPPAAFGPPPFPGEMYSGYMNGPRFPSAVNGSQVNGYATADNSPLNASVPEFSPVFGASNGLDGTFSTVDWMDQAIHAAQTITDEEVSKLHMVVQGQTVNSKEPSKLPNGTSNESEDDVAAKANGVHIESDLPTTYVHPGFALVLAWIH